MTGGDESGAADDAAAGEEGAEAPGPVERPLSAWVDDADGDGGRRSDDAGHGDHERAGGAGGAGTAARESLDLDPSLPERVRLGVELLARCEAAELSVKEAVDRVETVTTDPDLTRRILETAAAAGAVEREGDTVTPRRGLHVSFAADVVVKEGEFDCRRCGTTLTEGHFLNLEQGELGPFGSSCIRRVTGRE
ncbi:MAG: DUF5830 family protein [Halobacteriaceae archaeon]